MNSAIHRFRLALVIQLLVLLTGVAGYMLLERWSFFDALYMTVITLATIGYSEVRELGFAGRAFTIGLIIAGLASGAYTAATFAEVVVGNAFRETLGRKRMERELGRLSDHYIICGWGRMGQEIVEQFRARKTPFVVVETNEDKCHRLSHMGVPHVNGDATDDQVLRAAGVERARGLITVAPNDAVNIFITLSARSLNKKLFIVARSVYEQDVHKLEIAGADRVISPYVIGGRRIAAAVFHPTAVDFLELQVEREGLTWELADVTVTGECGFAGRTLRDCGIRERTGCNVLAVREAATQRFRSNPAPESTLQLGDTLIVFGTPEQLEQLHKVARVRG